MNNEEEIPQRRSMRLKGYDYSSKGAYFITVCIQDRKRILSRVSKPAVGVGALDDPCTSWLHLTPIGKIVERNLLSSEKISGVKIEHYVIMPDHLHAIIFLNPKKYVTPQSGSSRAPTPTNQMLPRLVSTFKRFCNREIGFNIFQRGYAEHIIRDYEDYETRARYIYENPIRWYYNKLHAKE